MNKRPYILLEGGLRGCHMPFPARTGYGFEGEIHSLRPHKIIATG